MTVIVCQPKPMPACECQERVAGAVCLDCDGAVDDDELRAEVRRLKSLAQSLNAGIEELPGWAQLRVAAMCSPCAGQRGGPDGDQ